MVGKSLPFEG
jgi:hypothetical protein